MISLRRLLSIIVLACAFTLTAHSSGQFEGKWVFDAEKSIFSPGPLPKSETLTFANGTVTVEGINPQGKPFVFSWTPLQGKAVPVILLITRVHKACGLIPPA